MASSTSRNRRNFLRFLAGSPLLAEAWAQIPNTAIANPKDALNVMDFEEAARKALPPAHWGYMATGVSDDITLRLNHEAYGHIQLRPRRLVDISKIDMSVELFGKTYETPIYLCPVGGQKAFYPAEGEVAVARAANGRRHLQGLST